MHATLDQNTIGSVSARLCTHMHNDCICVYTCVLVHHANIGFGLALQVNI